MRGILKRIILVGMVIDIAIVTVLFALKRRLQSKGDEYSDHLELVTILDGLELRSRAAAFRGGSMLTAAGGALLDLRDATLAPEGAALNVKTWMGGVRIIVPETWAVEVRGRALMGGLLDRTGGGGSAKGDAGDGGDGTAAPRLVVDALSVWGGVEVGHPRPGDRKAADLAGRTNGAERVEPGGATAGIPI